MTREDRILSGILFVMTYQYAISKAARSDGLIIKGLVTFLACTHIAASCLLWEFLCTAIIVVSGHPSILILPYL